MQFIQFQSQDPNSLSTPSAGNFNIFVDQTDNTLKIKDNAGEVYGGGGGYSDTTYSELVSAITTSGLTAGSFYLISNFRTCYDQPDFDIDGNPITTGNYKQAAIQPIMVFATSISTISTDAYQPAYPNDRIQYDWTWDMTEVTSGTSYGRITERIDEYGNRTDYDHRTIQFKRYRLYTNREGLRLNGTIQLFNTGIVSGTSTSFSALTVGNVVYIPDADPSYYEIIGITGNTSMRVSGNTIGSTDTGAGIYLAVEETNDTNGYFSYKRTNVKTNNFTGYTTFGNALTESYAKNNYVGNYANNYTNVGSNTFILANNVFLEGEYESNKFGDYCYNNTFGSDNQNNIWGDYCSENVSVNDIDSCIFGHYFYGNLINVNLTSNNIGSYFNGNRLLAENNEDFIDNTIGNQFNNNTIYSRFYENTINHYFNNNTIGDFGNLDELEFNGNNIGNYFNSNTIRKHFGDNKIGNYFENNVVNGPFFVNIIGDSFENNQNIGSDFGDNKIGNNFGNNSLIGDDFENNVIHDDTTGNRISYRFQNNKIGNAFEDNTLPDLDYFNWNDTTIENLQLRTFDTFYKALGANAVGNRVLGKEFIMHDTENDEYHKIKFTQWTQGGNGGGFSYERTKIYPTEEPTVYFTKRNYENDVDIIVPGSIEIVRDSNQNGIYNRVSEEGWNSSQSPLGTQWNSIYTQPNNGREFGNNKIGDGFYNNTIDNYFGVNWLDEYDSGNVIGDDFSNNTIGKNCFGNNICNRFQNNIVGEEFQLNFINSRVRQTTLSSCALYSAQTVNVFQNASAESRISYYDESDVLTIESLTEAPCEISFTIRASDFTDGNAIDNNTDPIGVNGVLGFENTDFDNNLDEGYYGDNLQGTSLAQLTAAYNFLGLSLSDSSGYVWNVEWGPGSSESSGLVKFGSNVDQAFFDIQVIDPSDSDWETSGNDNGTSLEGTFLFPAKFTIYLPLIDKGGWC
jgi:hypothetical protein